MSKLAFLASFLAAFVTMDEQFFNGESTRAAWYGVTGVARMAEKQIQYWVRPYARR